METQRMDTGQHSRPALLRATEAAELLGVGRATVYEWMAKGLLPSIRLGRSVRIPEGALHAMIAEKTRSTGE